MFDIDCTLLVDFNNLAFRAFFAKEVGAYTINPDLPLWRYIVYESVFDLLRKFKNVNGVVIAIDDKNSWRKSYFSRYKESRKKRRDNQKEVDWDLLFTTMVEYTKEIKHHMPFKVMKVRSAEADDIIGTLALGLKGDCIISSNDEDYLQSCSNRVKIWNPSKRELVECENPEDFLIEKCLTGQAKDDVFNVKTPNTWGQTPLTEGKRKPGLGKKTAEKIMKGGYKKWLEDNSSFKVGDIITDCGENFKRNRILIDFNYIPNTIKNRILDQHENYNFPPPQNIHQFFKKYHLRGFLEDFTVVEKRLMELY